MRSLHRLLPLFFLVLAGCSWAPSLGVHKIDVNQGNALTQDLVEKLKPGQTRAQVRAILGSPLLADMYHADRWDYVYEFRYQGKLVTHRSFSVFFAEEKLTRWQGDEQPPSPAILNRQAQAAGAADKSTPTPTTPEEPGVFSRFWNWLKS